MHGTLFNGDSVISIFCVERMIKIVTEEEEDYLRTVLAIKGKP